MGHNHFEYVFLIPIGIPMDALLGHRERFRDQFNRQALFSLSSSALLVSFEVR